MSDLACNPALTLTDLVYNTSYCIACSTVMCVTVPSSVFLTSSIYSHILPHIWTLLSVPVAPFPIPCTWKFYILACYVFFCLVTSYSCCTDWSRGTQWHSWLRHCAARRKISGSISDGVIGIFHGHNPSGRTMTLGLTQPLTEVSTRNISWGVKAAGA